MKARVLLAIVMLLALVLPMAGTVAASGPVVTPGYVAPDESDGKVRYRSFQNTGQDEIYIGIPDLGVAANRLAKQITWVPGTNNVTFTFDKLNDKLTTTVSNTSAGSPYTIDYPNFTSQLVAKGKIRTPNDLNVMQITVKVGDAGSTVDFNNVKLDGNPLGNFGGTGTFYSDWMVTQYCFGKGFTLTGDVVLSGSFSSSAENSRVEVGVGVETDYGLGCGLLSPAPSLALSTDKSLFCTGKNTTVNIDLANVTNLYGYQFQVSYDSAVASATGAFVNSFFDTTTNAFVQWAADCTTTPGTCKFAVAKQETNPPSVSPVSGSGALAQITLTGATPGTFNMKISNDVLSDKDGAALYHELGADLPITVCGLATVSGFVTLQGRPGNNKDTGTVSMFEQGSPPYFPAVAPVTFNATNGAYSIQVPYMPGGTSYKIRAEHGLYLGNEEVFNVTGNVTKDTRLWGGDANNDARVSVLDLSCIGGAFGISPITSTCGGTGSPNINADAVVNIQDLSITGGNYDKCSYQPWNTALPGNYNCPTPLTGHTVLSSPALSFSDGGWGGWSCPAGKVVVGGGFEATAPVAVSAPGTPGSVWPHYTYGPAEYGWVVRDAPDGVPNTITIRPICADPPPGYQVVKSAQLNYSGTGWGGQSCPAGKIVTGGGFENPGAVLAAAPATPLSVWPHYTYPANEWGWVVQNGGVGGTGYVYSICAAPVWLGYEVAQAGPMNYSDGGWGGWSCPSSKKITGGGFTATGPVAASSPAWPGSIWSHYTYGASEYGWVVRDYTNGAGSSTTVYSVCVP